MRLMIVVHDFAIGGSERIALRLGSRWAAAGHDVAVFCSDPAGPLRRLVGPGVRVLAGEARRAGGGRSRPWRTGLELAGALRRQRPDIVFLPGNSYLNLAPALKLLGPSQGCSVVWKISNVLGRADRGRRRQRAFDLGLRLRCRFVDHFVFMSESLRQADMRRVSNAPRRCHVVDQPVLDEAVGARPPAAATGRRPRVVGAGRLVAQKNFGLLLDAFRILRRTLDAELHLLGDGPQRAALEARAAALGLSEAIRFHGFVDDVRAHLAGADLFVLASNYEGFPSALVEALAAGLPVVSTDCSPAIPDIVPPEAGAIVPAGDAAALADAMLRVLDRGPPPPEAAEAAVNRYVLAASAERYLQLFGEILDARSRPAGR